VVDCINLKRSNTSGSVKREFVSKWTFLSGVRFYLY
jgi:hypothetical protein